MGLKNFYLHNTIEAGTDEAGRGCLAGPVVAAAVILATDFAHPLLNDSKQLTEKQRDYDKGKRSANSCPTELHYWGAVNAFKAFWHVAIQSDDNSH